MARNGEAIIPSTLNVFSDTAAYQMGEPIPGAEALVAGPMTQSPAEVATAAAPPARPSDATAERFARWTAENSGADQSHTSHERTAPVLASPDRPHPARRPETHTDPEFGHQRIIRTAELGREDEPRVYVDVAGLKKTTMELLDPKQRHDQDRILVNPNHGIIGAYDGGGGGTYKPQGPEKAASESARTFNAHLSAAGGRFNSDQEALDAIMDAYHAANMNIEHAGGTFGAASTFQVVYINGKPKGLWLAAGDCPLLSNPKPPFEKQVELRAMEERVKMFRSWGAEDSANAVEAQNEDRIAKDGILPYSWTRDGLTNEISSWVGATENGEEGRRPPVAGLMDLEPGLTRVAISTDGITGDVIEQHIAPREVDAAMGMESPIDVAQAFMDASLKDYDDKSIVVMDIYVSGTKEVPLTPPAEDAKVQSADSPATALHNFLYDIDSDDEDGRTPVDALRPEPAPLAPEALVPPAAPEALPIAEPGAPTAETVVPAEANETLPSVDSLSLTYDAWKDKLPAMDDDGEPMSYKKWLGKMPLERKLFLERHDLLNEVPEPTATPEPVVPAEPAPANTGDRPAPASDENVDWSDGYLPDNLTGDTSTPPAGIPAWISADGGAPADSGDISGSSSDSGRDLAADPDPDAAPVAPVMDPNVGGSKRGKKFALAAGVAATAAAGIFAGLAVTDGGSHDHGRAQANTAPAKPTAGGAKLGSGLGGSNAGNNGELTTSAVQHDGAIDYRVVERDGKIIRVETNLENRGLNGHGTPWAAATEALRLSGIEHPTASQIDALKDATLKAKGISEAQAHQLPDNYSISYDMVDGKLVPRQ